MKVHGVTVEQAEGKLRGLIDEAWMDVVEGCPDGKHPTTLLEKMVNLAQGMDMYKRGDAYTLPIGLKHATTSMLVDPISTE
jgi:hypothetical protein